MSKAQDRFFPKASGPINTHPVLISRRRSSPGKKRRLKPDYIPSHDLRGDQAP